MIKDHGDGGDMPSVCAYGSPRGDNECLIDFVRSKSRMLSLEPNDPVTLGLRGSARRLVGVAIFSGVVNLLTLSGSLYMLQVYDRVISTRNIATLVGLSVIVLLAYLLQGYFDALRTHMLARVGALFDASLQEPIHVALAALPLKGARPVLAQQPLRDLDQIRAFLSGIGPTAFLDMPWTPMFLVVLFLFHPLIGVTALLGAGAIVAMTILTEHKSRGAAKIAMECSAQRQVLADATRQNAEVIRALGMTGRLTARWAQANERFLQENVRVMDVHANLGSGAKILRYALQSALLGIGAYLVVIEQASAGIMMASSIVMGRALAPIEVALSTWKQLAAARQGIGRLRDILKATALPKPPDVILPAPCRRLLVRNLGVTAPGSARAIVADVSFSLDAGAGLALLGASASGKSSLVKALVGVWPASSGVVRLDEAALDQWRLDDVGRHIGYLPQDVALFDGSVAENIARFEETASSEAILQAARVAGAHEMILRLPDGYSTRIGEGGVLLSAGQRQRIGLARAVFGNPFLIILDEPNANLDADGETALAKAIESLRRGNRIVIVVSHRSNVLTSLDMAMVLHAGRAIAFGPREQVLADLARATASLQPLRAAAAARAEVSRAAGGA
jgi:ATP-binding cassette, subfamily C, type I secretion system permease/ATPase